MLKITSHLLLFWQHGTHQATSNGMSLEKWFGLLELPFLIVCIVFAFRTAKALRGGVWGKGMNYLAWGFLVMAVGHLNMQFVHHFNWDLFEVMFGQTGGTIAWFIALVITWGLSALGFQYIYKVSKGS